MVIWTPLDGGHGGEGGGGGMTPTGGLGPPPPFFFFLEVPECFSFGTAGDFWFLVSDKAWCHFAICNDVQLAPQSILEEVIMALV